MQGGFFFFTNVDFLRNVGGVILFTILCSRDEANSLQSGTCYAASTFYILSQDWLVRFSIKTL